MRGCIEEVTSVADGMKVVSLASIVYVSYLQEVLFFMVLGGGGGTNERRKLVTQG